MVEKQKLNRLVNWNDFTYLISNKIHSKINSTNSLCVSLFVFFGGGGG